MENIVVAALYQFVSLPDRAALRDTLEALLTSHGIKGTLLLAHEGINGTVAGTRAAIDVLKDFLTNDGRFGDMEYKESFADEQPFLRTKVRLKKEIVTLGVPQTDPTKKVGTYVTPHDWNALLEDPDVIVLDVRNDYEVEIGTFKNAKDPKTKTFRQFPQYVSQTLDPTKHKKVAMFCTGGIRCEKASSYMLEQGFEEVYHLKGGILRYLETMPTDASLWEGECFVFDDRVAVGHGLRVGDFDLCHGCRQPISAEDKASPLFVEGVTCHRCHAIQSPENRKRAMERQRQMELARQRGQRHLGR